MLELIASTFGSSSRNHIHIYKEMDNDTGNLTWAYDLEGFEQIDFNTP